MKEKEVREIIIKFKVSDDMPEEICELAQILTETKKPSWQRKFSGWRTGQRGLSERALVLMLDAVRFRNKQTNSLKKKDM